VFFWTASFLIASAVISFLNGALDRRVLAEVPATVIRKVGGTNAFALTISWQFKEQRLENTFIANRQMLSVLEPGDPVRLMVHPGAFSVPWYGGLSADAPRDRRGLP
jgi:hypothetical protein